MQKTMKVRKKSSMVLMTAALAGMFFLLNGTESRAEATATAKADINIRQEANTTSTVIGSTTSGKTVTIKDGVKDASGTIWYRVYMNADTLGYIRSDLVSMTDGSDAVQIIETTAQTETPAATDTPNMAGGAAAAAETPMDLQYASVKVAKAKIRTAPSTNDAVVDSMPQNTQLVVSGQSNGNDGVWYYVTFTGTDGTEKTGFIRSDLVELGEMLPVVEEPEPVEPEITEPEPPAEPVNSDYALVYEMDDHLGKEAWRLYDYTVSPAEIRNVEEVLTAVRGWGSIIENNKKTITGQRIAIVVMAFFLAAFIVAIIIMAFKLRDAYYEDYEDDEDDDDGDDDDDDEDDDEEERRPARVRRQRGEEEERPVRVRRQREEEEERSERARRPEARERAEGARRAEASRRAEGARRPETSRREELSRRPVSQDAQARGRESAEPPKRKAKNFLIDDDDFEFEFLNMDDKNN